MRQAMRLHRRRLIILSHVLFMKAISQAKLAAKQVGLSNEAKVKKRPAARIGDNDRKSQRGFGSMAPAEQKRIASAGGKASHAGGQGHKWTPEEASAAGRKGGIVSRRGAAKPRE